MKPQSRLLFDHEIIVDLFAGGGGLSIACEAALGRSPDIAINHNDDGDSPAYRHCQEALAALRGEVKP